MKEKFLVFIALVISFGIGFMVGQIILIKTQKPNIIVQKVIDRSLDKYSIENLSKFEILNSKFEINKVLKEYPNFISNEFIMEYNSKKVSGLVNIPKKEGKYPLIVMIRGYVPSEQYFVGNGTINASLFFTKNGYITISPDFLGYGDSDKETDNIFEARFQTYTTVMALLQLIKDPAFAKATEDKLDASRIAIWAHSNGGNIALTTLEATGVNYPTVLWAPVSAPFPFSILYYSDEVADHGKFLRRELSKFEAVYEADKYSLTNYLKQIEAPIQIDQGTADTSVPVEWSSGLAKTLKDQGLKINYNKFPEADHEMTPLWNTVIEKDLNFFNDSLEVLPH